MEDNNKEGTNRLEENQEFKRETTPQPGTFGCQQRNDQSSKEKTLPSKISNLPKYFGPKRQSKCKWSSSSSSSSSDDNTSLYSETFSLEDEAKLNDEGAKRTNIKE